MSTSRDDLLALLALKKQEFKDKWIKNAYAPSNHKRVVEDVPELYDGMSGEENAHKASNTPKEGEYKKDDTKPVEAESTSKKEPTKEQQDKLKKESKESTQIPTDQDAQMSGQERKQKPDGSKVASQSKKEGEKIHQQSHDKEDISEHPTIEKAHGEDQGANKPNQQPKQEKMHHQQQEHEQTQAAHDHKEEEQSEYRKEQDAKEQKHDDSELKGQAPGAQEHQEQKKKDEQHQKQEKHSKETDTDARPSAEEAPAIKQQQDTSNPPSQPDPVQPQQTSYRTPSVADQADTPQATEDDDFPVTEQEEMDQEKTVVAEPFFEGYGIAAGHDEDEFGGLGLIGVFEESNVSSIGASLDSSYRLNIFAILSLFLVYYILAKQK